jgi:hypothetical protein
MRDSANTTKNIVCLVIICVALVIYVPRLMSGRTHIETKKTYQKEVVRPIEYQAPPLVSPVLRQPTPDERRMQLEAKWAKEEYDSDLEISIAKSDASIALSRFQSKQLTLAIDSPEVQEAFNEYQRKEKIVEAKLQERMALLQRQMREGRQ